MGRGVAVAAFVLTGTQQRSAQHQRHQWQRSFFHKTILKDTKSAALARTVNRPLGPLPPAFGLVHPLPQFAQERKADAVVLVLVVVEHTVGVHVHHRAE